MRAASGGLLLKKFLPSKKVLPLQKITVKKFMDMKATETKKPQWSSRAEWRDAQKQPIIEVLDWRAVNR